MKDYYKILKIQQNATLDEIRKAYRVLAFQYHPDKNNSIDAPKKFIEITEAYEVLKDIQKRKKYDEYYFSFEQKTTQKEANINEWEKFGSEKAEEYSNMNFETFLTTITNELKVIKKKWT